jgi:hypothetical protein
MIRAGGGSEVLALSRHVGFQRRYNYHRTGPEAKTGPLAEKLAFWKSLTWWSSINPHCPELIRRLPMSHSNLVRQTDEAFRL